MAQFWRQVSLTSNAPDAGFLEVGEQILILGGPDVGGIGGPNTLGPGGPTAGPSAGIAAVVSKSSAASIKVFKNRRQYNQWIVTVQDVMPRSAVGGPQPGQQPGQPGLGGPGRSPGSSTPMSPTPGMPTRRTP